MFVEKDCTVEFQGKKFESGGAIITDDYLTAYPGKNGVLNDWHGNKIGTYSTLSKRRAIFFGRYSWVGNWYYYMRANVDGKVYSLRGFGEGMLARGKRLKSA